jgi:hypothetical protein
MTIDSDVQKVRYDGNDIATSFSFAFTIHESGNLSVVITDVDGVDGDPLTEGTGAANYSVTVAAYPGPGSITYPASGAVVLATGEAITINRVMDLLQPTDLENQGGYFPEVQETVYDRLTMIDQQQQEQIDRSLKIPLSSSTSISVLLPPPSAGLVVGWNDTEDGLVNIEPGAQGPQGIQGIQGPTGASGGGSGDMVAAQNLNDLANKSTARTNLGVAIGTDVQAYDAELAAIAGLTSAANKIPKFTGAGTAGLLDFVDEDSMVSDSATALPSQQSVKAYVDAEVASITAGISAQKFEASGTWTKPANVKFVKIVCVGAGGGGAGAGIGTYTGGGGGAGSYAEKILDVTAVSTATITIGAAGAAGSSSGSGGTGGTGGDTSFGTDCIGKGGAGGVGPGSTAAGGAGGVAGTGDITIAGQVGDNGDTASASLRVGEGGHAPLGYGFGGRAVLADADGVVGVGYGAGGSGATGGPGAQSGGAGKAGLCLVYEFK